VLSSGYLLRLSSGHHSEMATKLASVTPSELNDRPATPPPPPPLSSSTLLPSAPIVGNQVTLVLTGQSSAPSHLLLADTTESSPVAPHAASDEVISLEGERMGGSEEGSSSLDSSSLSLPTPPQRARRTVQNPGSSSDSGAEDGSDAPSEEFSMEELEWPNGSETESP
jgi:hypothetical protein